MHLKAESRKIKTWIKCCPAKKLRPQLDLETETLHESDDGSSEEASEEDNNVNCRFCWDVGVPSLFAQRQTALISQDCFETTYRLKQDC